MPYNISCYDIHIIDFDYLTMMCIMKGNDLGVVIGTCTSECVIGTGVGKCVIGTGIIGKQNK